MITIPGAPANPYMETGDHYDYAQARARCPGCGGVGVPWNGWFSCEGGDGCRLIAVVEGGRCFKPVEVKP